VKKKNILYIIIVFIVFLFYFNLDKIRSIGSIILSENQKQKIRELFFGKGTADLFKKYKVYGKMNYNQNILPKTQFVDIELKEFILEELDLNVSYSKWGPNSVAFFLEQYNNDIILADTSGNFFFIDKIFLDDFSDFQFVKVNTNFKATGKRGTIKDLFIYHDYLYISYSDFKTKDCTKINISKSKISKIKLNFEIFFKSKDCNNEFDSGRMSFISHNGKDGLIVTTDTELEGLEAQDDNSSFGKTLFIDFEKKKSLIFSKGHRTPQGLYTNENIILSAEHGPRGGDEINLIKFGGNYGWPISSYGEPYYSQKFYETENSKNSFFYKKSHSDYDFIEPIYSFIPSIGINQIIKIPDNFSSFWKGKGSFLVTSLNGRSVYRIMLDKNFEKLISKEKIFIGRRIRDIIYLDEKKVFLLALEGSKPSMTIEGISRIGVLKEKTTKNKF